MNRLDQISGQLLLQLHAKGMLFPNGLEASIHYLKSDEYKTLGIHGNMIVLNLAFEGNAVIKIEGSGVSTKWIHIIRFHSAPFPKQGGFCLTINLYAANSPFTPVTEEQVRIFSADFIEHIYISEQGKAQSRPLHNLISQS